MQFLKHTIWKTEYFFITLHTICKVKDQVSTTFSHISRLMKDRIRQIMESKKMTQKEFASELCIAEGTLSSVFTGRTRPTNHLVNAIHERFPEVNILWLMFGEGEMLQKHSGTSGGDVSIGEQPDDNGSRNVTGVQQDMFSSDATAASVSQPIHEIVKYIDKPQRKITEIRVFYDDGTFETFFA